MQLSAEYFAVIVNSTLRMTAPLLLAALTAAACAKVNVFNISMEGTMTAGAFFSIVANHYTHSVWLSVLAAVCSSVLLSAAVGLFTIRLGASPVVVGLATNTLVAGLASYLLYSIFQTKGMYTDPSLVSLAKINLPLIRQVPLLSTALSNLTAVDYLSWLSAAGLYLFLYRTVAGYRLRAVGINPEAARSLGAPVERCQFLVLCASGVFTGLAGVLLSMGSVTLYIQNITSGRGYIAMAANSLAGSHPLGVIVASLFFGICQAVGTFLQNTSLKTQITASVPYVATILALVAFSLQKRHARNQKRKEDLKRHETLA